jgi:serine/threonine-protein kinase
MGEVYRARDERLGRDVALKVVRSEFTQSPDRLARFQREAQLLASLNHPHIAAIHGLEEAGGLRFLVLELVEGETLAERLARGPLSLEEVLPLARQMAEALEYAHEKGIIHRDLKPANVKITPDGAVKLLDFGLAKALDTPATQSDIGDSPTLSDVASRTGVLLGTAAYMSPEQARAKPADRRADIWAFGGVLFEMLTARRPFEGETVYDLISAILSREPDWSALPPATPPVLQKLLRRCLHKDPKQRLQAIGEARITLDEALHPVATEATGAAAPARLPRRVLLLGAISLVGGLVLGIVFGRLGPRGMPAAPGATPVRAVVRLPEGTLLAGWASPVIAVSPDGRKLAFVVNRDGRHQLYIRHLDKEEAMAIPDSDGAEGPFFSPDSQWVAFAAGNISGRSSAPPALKKVSVDGGLPQKICDIADYFGGDWGEDGTIVFVGAELQGLWRVPAAGGTPERITPAPEGSKPAPALAWPNLLPGGRWAVAVNWTGAEFGRLVGINLRSGEIKDLGLAGLYARYSPTGHLLYTTLDASLLAVRFDPSAAALTGSPVKLQEDIALSSHGVAVFSFAQNGTLLYATGYVRDSGRELAHLVQVDVAGKSRVLSPEPETFESIALSPDGTRLAATTWLGSAVEIHDLGRGSRFRLPRGDAVDLRVNLWTLDGRHVIFTSGAHLFRQAADGSGPPELLRAVLGEQHASSWTPDGRQLAIEEFLGDRATDFDIVLWPLQGNGQAQPLLRTPARERRPRISPDGRWIAYVSNESGREEVYVQSFPKLGNKVAVSAGGGNEPHWSRDGRELYYLTDRSHKGVLMAVSVTLEPAFHAGPPTPLGEIESRYRYSYDALPGRRQFVALERVPESGMHTELHLVLNWFEELRRLAPNK